MMKGKFVFYSGKEHYRTGRIVHDYGDVVMVQFDNMNTSDLVQFPMEMVCLPEMACNENEEDGLKVWGFFDTRKKLDAFVAWMEKPEKPAKIVSLVPKKTRSK